MKHLSLLLSLAALIAAPAFAETLEQIPSPDGKLVARVERADGDWQRIDLADTVTGQVREHLDWAAYTSVAWLPDGSGFYYSRMPQPHDASAPESAPSGPPRGFHEVDFHKVGTLQSNDELVYFTDRFNMFHTAQVTADGRWLVVTSSLAHEPRHEIILLKLNQTVPAPWKLIRSLSNAWWFAGSQGNQFYFVTDLDAPRGRLVAIDINAYRFKVREIVPQGDDTLKSTTVKPDGIELTYATRTVRIPLETAQ